MSIKTIVVIDMCLDDTTHIQNMNTCLHSIKNQKYKTDILILISIDDLNNQSIFFNNKKNDNIEFMFCKKNISEFEKLRDSLHILMKYDLLFFCNKNSAYHKNRIDLFVETYEKIKNELKEEIPITIHENKIIFDELWLYAIKPIVLKNFFEDVINNDLDIIKNPFCYLIFVHYININTKIVSIIEHLYFHRFYDKKPSQYDMYFNKYQNHNFFEKYILYE